MDHLPQPAGGFRKPLQIPYVCTEAEAYDNSGFFEYETRVLGAEAFYAPTEDGKPRSANPRLQAWLIFGMLHEVFVRISGLEMASEDFIRTREDGKRVVTMERLYDLIYQWHAREERSDLAAKKERLGRVLKCLQFADQFILLMMKDMEPRLPDAAVLDDPFHSEYPTLAAILLCATVLGFELNRALWTVFGDAVAQTDHHQDDDTGYEIFDIRVSDELPGLVKRDFQAANGANLITTRWMEQAGWCPFEIATCDRTFLSQGNIVVRLYLGQMDRRPLKVDHSKCNGERCQGHEVDFSTYKVRHERDNCDCEHVVLEDPKDVPSVADSIILAEDGERLEFLLELTGYPPISAAVIAGAVPLIRLDLDKLSLSIHRWKEGDEHPPFVAISHVWSEGMGNPNCNSLPTCTIKVIQYMVEQCCPGVDNLHFWIDTLCVPTPSGLARKRAILNMRNIYSAAEKVLVFDDSLRLASGFSYREELLMRIKVSLWSTRLWTLQEARLSSKLSILFKDRTFEPGTAEENSQFSQKCAVYFESPDVAGWEKAYVEKKNPWALELLRACAAMGLPGGAESLERIGETVQTPYGGTLISRIHWFNKLKYVRHDAEYSILGTTSQPPVSGTPDQLLFNLVPWLNNRAVTRAEDETICLGTLVGVPLAPLLDLPTHAARMFRFLRTVGPLPRGILWLETEKSKTPGRRWMPLSLVLRSRVRIFGPADTANRCRVNSAGHLEMASAGLVPRAPFAWSYAQTLHRGATRLEMTDEVPTPRVLLALPDGRRFFVAAPWEAYQEFPPEEKRFAVIFSEVPDRDHLPQRVVVVSLVPDSNSPAPPPEPEPEPEPKKDERKRDKLRSFFSRPRPTDTSPSAAASLPLPSLRDPSDPDTPLRVRYEFLAWIFPVPEECEILAPQIFQPLVSWHCEVAKARTVGADLTGGGQRWVVE